MKTIIVETLNHNNGRYIYADIVDARTGLSAELIIYDFSTDTDSTIWAEVDQYIGLQPDEEPFCRWSADGFLSVEQALRAAEKDLANLIDTLGY